MERGCTDCHISISTNSLFFGYPSLPKAVTDAVQNAIELIRNDQKLNVTVIDWKELPIEGNIIFCEICKAIRQSNCVVLNVTDANFNILFEYGFAIGIGAAIWPLVEEGIEKGDRLYSQIETLTTIGYSTFTNSKSIITKIRKKKPWERVPQFKLPAALGLEATREATGLLYIKSTHNDEPSLTISETLFKSPLEIITDDPIETPFQPLSWYLSRIGKSYAVVVNLGSERISNVQKHWAKCALVAGIALALGRRLLIIGENTTFKPIDYRDIMKNYENSAQAQSIIKEFLTQVVSATASQREYKRYDITKSISLTDSLLYKIDLGDYTAENEMHFLESYFIETPEFIAAREPTFKLFIGRKGSGKTANFYMLFNLLQQDRRNIVCQIKPKEYELEELLQFVKTRLDSVEKGYFLESLWKFMLYSEALKSIYENAMTKFGKAGQFEAELAIIEYVDSNAQFFEESFTSRLVQTVRKLCQFTTTPSRVAISELLHTREIKQIHEMIVNYIIRDTNRFAIIIDNLDQNWRLDKDYITMADLLLALINAAKDMWRSIETDIYKHKSSVGMSVLIFLRSDIFTVVLNREREPDKLQYVTISWRNIEQLLPIIDKRIATSVASIDMARPNWIDILEWGLHPREMIYLLKNNILMRPRDIIYYFQRVLYNAQARNAYRLAKNDFSEAMTEYSEYVLMSLSAESQPYIPNMTDLLFEFSEGKQILSVDAVNSILLKSGITNATDMQKTQDFLLETNFLGYGIDNNNYSFPTNPVEADIARRKSLRHAQKHNKSQMFKIHRAFHESLDIR